MKLRIGILGTRGIPNNYGGFEQISGYLAQGLVERGHEVTVYNSHKHPYKKEDWNGVKIIHCFDPEYIIGTAGQFVYDFNCVLDARKQMFDVILFMGYTSSSVWGSLYPRNTPVISNMDGLEWKRSKYSKPVQKFLQWAENLAVKYSNAHIADSLAIQKYLKEKYSISPTYIPYGAEVISTIDRNVCDEYQLIKNDYLLLIARMEPENNIEMILSGFQKSNSTQHFAVVGDIKNKYGRYLSDKFKNEKRIRFTGPIFDMQKLHSLRVFASLYFHGHSVGGTNPSLLEAMASKTFIAAHNNAFNKHILEKDALYFSTEQDVKKIIEKNIVTENREAAINNNFNKILSRYNWDRVVNKYEHLILSCCNTTVIEENIYHQGYVSK
ncbi:DUF1972 domain-containing protein [Chitinophagaceae bacterium LWZ2-11]